MDKWCHYCGIIRRTPVSILNMILGGIILRDSRSTWLLFENRRKKGLRYLHSRVISTRKPHTKKGEKNKKRLHHKRNEVVNAAWWAGSRDRTHKNQIKEFIHERGWDAPWKKFKKKQTKCTHNKSLRNISIVINVWTEHYQGRISNLFEKS